MLVEDGGLIKAEYQNLKNTNINIFTNMCVHKKGEMQNILFKISKHVTKIVDVTCD